MAFKDCFDKEIKYGDDVLISVENVIHCGVVLEMTENKIVISIQVWFGENEIMKEETYYNNGENLRNIYKLPQK